MRRLGPILLAALLGAAMVPSSAVAEDPPPPPTVTLKTDRPAYVAGSRATITVTVKDAANRDLLVTATRPDGKTYFFGGAEHVNDTSINLELPTDVNTRIIARLCATTDTCAADDPSATIRVVVRAYLTTTTTTKRVLNGRYSIFAFGTAPRFRSQAKPARPGAACLRHEVQRVRDGRWVRVALSGCKVEGARGRVEWTWSGTHPRKVNFRVRAISQADAYNASGTSGWFYFRFR